MVEILQTGPNFNKDFYMTRTLNAIDFKLGTVVDIDRDTKYYVNIVYFTARNDM